MFEIPYRQEGDYLIPDLESGDKTDRPVGKYGRMRRKYLEEHQPAQFEILLIKGKLMEHLADVQEEATEMVELLIQQFLEKDPGPNKATDQMGWVGHMNNLKAEAEEFVVKELIYN